MKKLTILLSVLMVALTSVFAQEPSVTLTPNKAQAFAEKSFFKGENKAFKDTLRADVAKIGDVKLAVAAKHDVFKAEFNADSTKLIVSYEKTSVAAEYKDTIIVSVDGQPTIADSLFVSLKVTEKERPVITVADASVFAWGEVALDDAEKGIAKETGVTLVPAGIIALEKSGAEAANFAAEIKDGKLVVVFTADAAGDYEANVKLTAEDAEPVDVKLTASVAMPAPELSVLPAGWEEDLTLKGGKAEAQKSFSIIGSYLIGKVKKEIQGGVSSKFQWDDAKQIVTFSSNEVGTFEDVLLVSTPKVKTVEIPLKVVVARPVITVGATSNDFGNVSLDDAINGAKKFETTVSVVPEVELKAISDNAAFKPEIKDGKLIIVFQAESALEYNGKVTVSAEDAESVEITLKAKVDMPKPELHVTPSEWKETVELKNGKAEAERQISISAVFTLSYPKVELQSGANFVWDATNSKVKFTATEEKTYNDVLIVSATNADTVRVALEITVKKGGDTPVEPVAVTGVTLTPASASVKVGNTVTLTAAVVPANADDKAVTWTTSDPAVATVADGVVTGVKAGSATITVKTHDGGFTATSVITVTDGEVPPSSDCDNYTYEFKAAFSESGKLGDYNWTLTMPSGTYTGYDTNNGKGAQFGSGSKAATSVTLSTTDASDCGIKEVVINASVAKSGDGKLSVFIGDTQIGETKALTDAATNYTFVNNAGAKGKLELRLKNTNKAMYIKSIAVNMGAAPAPVAVTGVTLDKNTNSIEAGKSFTLTATVAPANATNKNVTWETSDAAVATVNEGLVYAKAEGTATITVKTVDGGFTASCTVTVTKSSTPIVAVTGVKLDKTSYEIMEGLTVTLTATVEPADATNKDVTWSSSDETVATVENGLVTTLKPGTATITVKTVDGGFTASCVITVNRESPPLPGDVLFNKVTADQTDWSGQYLLVYEKSATEALVFSGKDAAGGDGYVSATITNGVISMTDYAKYCVFVEKMDGGYSMKIGDNYFGGKDGANAIVLGPEPIANTMKQHNADSLDIISVGNYMRFNKTADQMRFRYYKAGSMSKQQRVFLYKADRSITPQPAWVPDTISVADAVKVVAEEKTHYVKGIISEIITTPEQMAQYKNCDFMLADIDVNSTEIKCYRLNWLKPGGEFTGDEIAVGDTVLVFGQTTIYTDKQGNKVNEIINGYVAEILGEGSGVGPTPHGEPLDIDYAEAAYIVDEEGPFWELLAGKYPTDVESQYLDYPVLILDIDNSNKTHLAGKYDIFYGILYLSDNDSIEFYLGSVYVTCIEAASAEAYPYYNFVATLIDENGKQYVYEFETEVIAYDYETDEDIILEDKAGDQAIENTEVVLDLNAPMYNLQGMQVGRGTRGVIIQNKHKFIIVQ